MRLQQYINEAAGDKESIQLLLQELYTKCMPFINDLVRGGWNYTLKGNNLMYSGRDANDWLFFHGIVRKNRRPFSTNKYEQVFLDDLFKKKFGWKARSNAIFCTGSYSAADSYGKPFSIFPIGKYKFLWNKDVPDLFTSFDFRDIKDTFINKHRKELSGKYKRAEYYDFTTDLYTKLDRNTPVWKQYEQEVYTSFIITYTNKNIVLAIKEKNEIMVNCKEYIAVNPNHEKNVKMYISEYGTKYPDNEIFEEFWVRWGNL